MEETRVKDGLMSVKYDFKQGGCIKEIIMVIAKK
jgi:hypothetical protein